MSDKINISDQAWLNEPALQAVFAALNRDGGEVRVVGGAVRNSLIGIPVNDVDMATTHLPEEVIRLAKDAGFKPVPTGIDHGTVTVVAHGTPFEVTSLREDIETDGRHAKVIFGTDWNADAHRRDFTINALYATADGAVVDYVDGLADIQSRTLRFIGEAEERIREDYLRILRFFRFFAWYGEGRPESEGLKASARLKDGLLQLSPERVWAELKKLLSAPDPARALLWMRQSGVLNIILPESEKWGIDAIHTLVRTESDLGWKPDPLLRLESIIPPDQIRIEQLGERLRMSNNEKARLEAWARTDTIKSETSIVALEKLIYRGSQQGVIDRIKLSYAAARGNAISSNEAMIQAGAYSKLLDAATAYKPICFPITGQDLLDRGYERGPKLGATLKMLESQWVDSGFNLDAEAMLENLDPKMPDL